MYRKLAFKKVYQHYYDKRESAAPNNSIAKNTIQLAQLELSLIQKFQIRLPSSMIIYINVIKRTA